MSTKPKTKLSARNIAARIQPDGPGVRQAQLHNLRAMLLRLADGDDLPHGLWDLQAKIFAMGRRRGLITSLDGVAELTDLGRKVAELLRPKPWIATHAIVHGHVYYPSGEIAFQVLDRALADRVAELLTADELARAKTYQIDES